MTDTDKINAFKTLGLTPGATKSQIQQAYQAMLAFSNNENAPGAVAALAEKMHSEIDTAYKILLSNETVANGSGDGTGTISDTTDKQSKKAPGGKNSGFTWALGIVLVGGFLYQVNHKEQDRPTQPAPIPPEQTTSTPSQTPSPSGNNVPDFVVPFVHNDDVSVRAARWTSGWENVNGAQFMVVWAYAANNDPVCKLELYQDNGTWTEQRQYIIRYSSDRLQVAVQRFQDQGSAALFKDQRNLSTTGDVLVQTTIYTFSPDTKLAAVQVDTPFMTAKDGLRFTRSSGAVYAERMPAGGQININSNNQWLNNLFDLWSTFGAPNV